MADNQGTFTLPGGTGMKSVNIGSAPDWADAYIQSYGNKVSHGHWHGGSQFAFSDPSAPATSGRFIKVRDNSGTVILDAEISSLSDGYLNLYVHTQSGTVPQVLIVFGNY